MINLEFSGHITENSGEFPIVNFNDCGLGAHLWETTTKIEPGPDSSCCKQNGLSSILKHSEILLLYTKMKVDFFGN